MGNKNRRVRKPVSEQYGTYEERTAERDKGCFVCGKPIKKGDKYLIAWCTSIGVLLHLECQWKKTFKELNEESWAP